ncbi:DUF1304 family protein [Streptomyces sp. TRM68416]|uniref:DUF1304 family protein n=1 Tax=Streptomyces sp. TRM68416 TaxID=2758412 RepID=UPI001661C640|nr:DUF1304 domain-containing protein [Streptomyces sp. TRM68416]MBD0839955.1 DUF1304 domain-containing protein [Streptomyces sp. TRM68416]
MNLVSQVFASLTALIHIVVGLVERFGYTRPAVRVFLTKSAADAPEVTVWRSGVAVYNVLLGLGLVAGVIALHTGDTTVGRTLIFYLCAFLIASAVLFWVSFPKLWQGALSQGVPPAVVLLAAAAA